MTDEQINPVELFGRLSRPYCPGLLCNKLNIVYNILKIKKKRAKTRDFFFKFVSSFHLEIRRKNFRRSLEFCLKYVLDTFKETLQLRAWSIEFLKLVNTIKWCFCFDCLHRLLCWCLISWIMYSALWFREHTALFACLICIPTPFTYHHLH